MRPDKEGDSDQEGDDSEVDPDADSEADPFDSDAWSGSRRAPRSTTPQTNDEWPPDPSSTDDLYSDGLRQLAAALEGKYDLDHISGISYELRRHEGPRAQVGVVPMYFAKWI